MTSAHESGQEWLIDATSNGPPEPQIAPAEPRRAVETTTLLEERTETGEPQVAHIVKTEPGETATTKVLEARVYGTPIEALCGHVWVPSRDPKQLPVCQKCKEIYEMYRGFNDGLSDTPSD